MSTPHDAEQRIDAYLARLRARLRGMDRDDIGDIIEELRTHIVDKAAVGGIVTAAAVDAALDGLGPPEALASEYLTDRALARAEVARLPWQILASLFRWATSSLAGFVVLLVSLLGYFFGAVSILVAVLKPFHPETAGLWLLPNGSDGVVISVRLGFGIVPASGRELLGWWIVPIGLVAGCALVTLTTLLALRCARSYRRSRTWLNG